jgi:hypothetical protein
MRGGTVVIWGKKGVHYYKPTYKTDLKLHNIQYFNVYHFSHINDKLLYEINDLIIN